MPKPTAAMEVPVPDYKETPLRRTKIEALVDRRITVKAEIKSLEEEAKEISDSILNLLIRHEQKSVLVDHYRVTQADGVHSSLSKAKLLELGVPQAKIEKATVRKEYTYLTVTDMNQAKEREDAD